MSRTVKWAALTLALACAGCEGSNVTRVIDSEHLVVKGHKIALHGVDAPSSSEPACDLEKRAADLTEERIGGLILAAKDVSFRKSGMACLQFMMCDGFVMADGVDIGETLIAEGLAVRKVPTGEPVRDWCVASPLPPPTAIDPSPVVPPSTPN
jgi:endonuclease YncB( thermonuclease family)